MKINFLDLKEFTSPASLESKILTKYIIEKMFDLHMQASQTVWDKEMFDEELKRKGSGFLICYSDGGSNENDIKNIKAGGGILQKFGASDIDVGIKLNLQSQIIGFFIFYSVLDEIHILDITVVKEMQSKGIGSLMLDWAIKKYKSAGIKYFFLEVRTSNLTAINLYKKFGFKIFMLRKNYYDYNKEDALCMVKEL